MSNGVTEEPYEIRQTFYLKQKRNRTNERIEFLQRCKEEQVLPASAPAQLRSKEHPFTRAARVYLEDAIASLQDNDTVLKNRTPNTELPAHLKNRLKTESFEHRANLQKKLDKLCQSSDWNKAGNSSLITRVVVTQSRIMSRLQNQSIFCGVMSRAESEDWQPAKS